MSRRLSRVERRRNRGRAARPARYTAVALGLLVFAAACGAPRPACAIVVDKIIAVVNDEVITQSEITRMLMPIYASYSKEFTGDNLRKKLAQAEDKILEQLIDEKLITSEAKRREIQAPDEDVEAHLADIKSRFSTNEEFERVLARDSLTIQELKDQIRNDLIKRTLVQMEIGWQISITPAEVKRYYDEHPEEFSSGEAARVKTILIRKGEEGRTDEEARFLVDKVREILNNGRPFREVAQEYSDDSNASSGGDMGLVERGDLMPAIDESIFSLEPGGLTDTIETGIGFHIFKVTERQPGRVIGFEAAREAINNRIYQQKIEAGMTKLLRELRRDAYISIK